MDTSKLEEKIKHQKNYGKKPEAMKKFKENTKQECFMAIESLEEDVTEFKLGTNEYNDGSSLRCFSKLTDDFFSIESINFAKDGRIDSFTKCIGYKNGGNISPSIRFDIGGNRTHDSNSFTNKYFTNEEETPHIHYCSLSANNTIIENALNLKHLIIYLKDLAGLEVKKLENLEDFKDLKKLGFEEKEIKLLYQEPENDINSDSYGLPYLAMKKVFEKNYGVNNNEFQIEITKMINRLLKAQKLIKIELPEKIEQLKNNGIKINNIHLHNEIKKLKYELLENVANVTFQTNLEKYSKQQVSDLEKEINNSKINQKI